MKDGSYFGGLSRRCQKPTDAEQGPSRRDPGLGLVPRLTFWPWIDFLRHKWLDSDTLACTSYITVLCRSLPPTMSSPSNHQIPHTALANLSPSDRVLFHRYGLGPTRAVEIPIVHHAFEAHARIQPNAVAVEHTLFNQSLTFAQLDVYANRLARRLRASNVQPGKRVCILARRSTHLIVAILATLKSGAQYVPLDAVTITDSTLNYVFEDSQPAAVLAMGEYVHRVRTTVPILELEAVIADDELAGADSSKPEDNTSPSDGAYVIYTSGTTGVPKGVDVKHRGVTNGKPLTPGVLLCLTGFYSHQWIPWKCRNGSWDARRPTAKHCI